MTINDFFEIDLMARVNRPAELMGHTLLILDSSEIFFIQMLRKCLGWFFRKNHLEIL